MSSAVRLCRFVRTAFSPDADYFVSGAADGRAYIWEVRGPIWDK